MTMGKEGSMGEKKDARGWICTSTQALIREARAAPETSFFDLIHGYVYGRWPYIYIAIGTGEHPLARPLQLISSFLRHFRSDPPTLDVDRSSLADTYHGKVLPLESARRLVTVNEPVHLSNLEHIIPYKLARDIILKNPDHIVALECPCRSARPDPCTPLDVCLVIGEPFASFVVEHHPRTSRWISQREAEIVLQEEHARGHVHHAFFKDAMLGRFYAICNCCPCCCGAMQAVRHGNPMITSSGYVSHVDEEACLGCGLCVEGCPFEALEEVQGIARVDRDLCMGCGVCVSACEAEAVRLVRDPLKGEPLEIAELMGAAGQGTAERVV